MAIVWDQSNFVTGNGTSISGTVAANNILFGSSKVLTKLSVWLSDSIANDNGALDSFGGTISWAIYRNFNGKPGDLLFSGTDASPLLTDTGAQSDQGGDIFQVDLDLGEIGLGVGNYWIAIHEGAWGSGDDGSEVRWVWSGSPLGPVVTAGTPPTGPTTWTSEGLGHDSAFALTATASSDRGAFSTTGGFDVSQPGFVADNFTIASATALTGATVYLTDGVLNDNGLFDSFSGAFTWSIIRSSGGAPGQIMWSADASNITVTDTGMQSATGADIFRVDFTFGNAQPNLTAGDYFFSIRENTLRSAPDGSPIYWNHNVTQSGAAAQQGAFVGGTGTIAWSGALGADTSFQLWSAVVKTQWDTVGPVNEDDSVLIDVLANDQLGIDFAITAIGTPNAGTAVLDDNGTPGDSSDDRILYTPFANRNGGDFFSYTVTSGNISSTAYITVTMRAANDPTTVNNFNGDAAFWNQGDAAVRLDTGVRSTFVDIDYGNNGTVADFGGGQLAIDITGGGVPGEDLIYFETSDRLKIVGADIFVGGVNIGSFIGSGGNRLLGLSNLSNPTLLAEAMQHLRYLNTGASPTGGTRTITYTLVDGDGTANGGGDTTVWTSTVDVIAYDTTGIANADTRALNEGQKVNIAVLANDSTANGPLAVTEINGQAIAIGGSVVLPSGAVVWLLAGGKLQYDTNGAFNWLASAATGAATGAISSYVDKFSYTLPDGSSAQVAVTVNGFDNGDGVLSGDAGNNTLTGTPGADTFLLQHGGIDIATGSDGNDTFYFGGAYATTDRVNGGAGADTLILQGNYGASNQKLVMGAGMLDSIEMLVLMTGTDTRYGTQSDSHRYYIKTADAAIAAGTTFTVQGSKLNGFESLTFDGSAETNANFRLVGGASNDSLIGGAGADLIMSGWGSDHLTGGGGNDIFYFREGDTSGGKGWDTITDYTAGDKIDFSSIDANTTVAGDQAFTWIGQAAFTNVAGQLRVTHDSMYFEWRIEGDTDGDGNADLFLTFSSGSYSQPPFDIVF